MADIFISYNRGDRDKARIVASALEAEGFSVWWDAALRAGETYDEVTEQNLRQAGAVVVLWSKRSSTSKWVRAEATVGEKSSALVPALIEECDRPVRFELVQTADLTQWEGDREDPNWRAFMQDIETAIARRAKAGAPAGAAAAAGGYSADGALSVETTFWNSIKDGGEAAEFEAYLDRYPNGHFAALAKNRLLALQRAKNAARAAPREAPREPVRPTPAPQARAVAPQAAPAQRPAAPPRPAAAPSPPPKRSGAGLMIGGALAVALGLGAAAYFMLADGKSGADAADAADAAEAGPVSASAAPISLATPVDDGASAAAMTDAAAEEPVGDVFAEADLAAQETDESLGEIPDDAAPPAVPETPSDAPPAAATTLATALVKPLKPGEGQFRDCETCPLMASLPAGAFIMGSAEDEPGRNAYEGPQREVRMPAFAIGVYEVTAGEWSACVADGACTQKRAVDDPRMPALGVSWRQANAYAKWLSKKTGKAYRLPTEAEWEYAARGGTATAYWWGDRLDRGKVVQGGAKPVGSLAANGFGVHDAHSNAREWVEDCYVNTYAAAPTDGSAVTSGNCSLRVIRGGYWASAAADMRAANRSRIDQGSEPQYMGFRVAGPAN